MEVVWCFLSIRISPYAPGRTEKWIWINFGESDINKYSHLIVNQASQMMTSNFYETILISSGLSIMVRNVHDEEI